MGKRIALQSQATHQLYLDEDDDAVDIDEDGNWPDMEGDENNSDENNTTKSKTTRNGPSMDDVVDSIQQLYVQSL